MTTTYNEGTASSLVTTKQEVQPYGLSQIVVDVPEFKVTGSEFWYTTSNGTSYNATYTEPAVEIRPINRYNTATGRARVESSGNLVYGARHRNENYDEFGASTADTRTEVVGATYIIPGPVSGTRPRFPIPYFPADSVGKTIVVEGQRRTILQVNNFGLTPRVTLAWSHYLAQLLLTTTPRQRLQTVRTCRLRFNHQVHREAVQAYM